MPLPTASNSRRLWLARAAWLAVAGPSVTLLVLLIPIHLRTVAYTWQFLDSYAAVAPFLPRAVYAAYWVSLSYLVTAVCLMTAGFIAWHKADERVAWLAGTVLVILPLVFGLGGNSETWTYYPEGWRPVLQIVHDGLMLDGGVVSLTAFVFLFPDGRFAPRWTAAVLGLVLGALALASVWQALGRAVVYELWLAVFIGALTIGAGAQLYRYRRRSSALERQQVKWVVASLTVLIATGPVSTAATLLSENTPLAPLVLLAANHVQLLAVCGLPLSLAVSIFRYRLWAIDQLIRRTLVYSGLTVALAGLYFGSVLAVQQLVNPLMGAGSSQLAVIGSTVLIAALAAPLNNRVQREIDRRFYRRRYDAAQTSAAFAATVRDEVALEQLTEQLLAAADETMQPAHASVWIRPVRKS